MMGDIPRRLQRVFDRIPDIRCEGHCHGACGPIAISEVEDEAIRVFCDANGVRYAALTGGIQEAVARMEEAGCASCPYLDEEKRCMVYPVRPAICRMFGVSESMPCPWGCVREGALTDRQTWKILRRLDRA